jgi:hypothetical protein
MALPSLFPRDHKGWRRDLTDIIAGTFTEPIPGFRPEDGRGGAFPGGSHLKQSMGDFIIRFGRAQIQFFPKVRSQGFWRSHTDLTSDVLVRYSHGRHRFHQTALIFGRF